MIVFYQPPNDDDDIGKEPETGKIRDDDSLLDELAADHVTHATGRLGKHQPPLRQPRQQAPRRKPLPFDAEDTSGDLTTDNQSQQDPAAEENILDAIVVQGDWLDAEVVEPAADDEFAAPSRTKRRGQRALRGIRGYLLDGDVPARGPGVARSEALARRYGQWQQAQSVAGQIPKAEVVNAAGQGLVSQIISRLVGLVKGSGKHGQ